MFLYHFNFFCLFLRMKLMFGVKILMAGDFDKLAISRATN